MIDYYYSIDLPPKTDPLVKIVNSLKQVGNIKLNKNEWL